MVVEAWMESREVGRSKLCLESLKLTRLAGLDAAPGSLLGPIVELPREAENAMMQQDRHRPVTTGPVRSGSPDGLAVPAATVSVNQRAKAAP